MIKFHYFLKKKFSPEIDYVKSLEIKQSKLPDKKKEKYLNKEKTQLDVGFRVEGKYFKVRTSERVFPALWDQKKQQVKDKHPLSFILNRTLRNLRERIEEGYRQLEFDVNENNPLTADQIKSMIKEKIDEKKPVAKSDDFFSVFTEFLKAKEPFFKKNNVKKYGTLKGHLLRFQKSEGIIKFEAIDEHFLERFTAFLLKTGKHDRRSKAKKEKPMQDPLLKNNSIAKLLANSKAFFRWCLAHDYISNPKVLNYKIKYDATSIVCFTRDEFHKLLTMDLSTDKIKSEVRDTFCFQALTGSRFSDCVSLHWGNIIKKNGGLVWSCFQHKGNKSAAVEIPLSDAAVRILERYPNRIPEGTRDKEGNLVHQRILPVRSEQVMNKHLKILAQMVGLVDVVVQVKYSGVKRIEISKERWELISTHTARRTFVTLSLEMGMRHEVVIAFTGHTTVKQLLRYNVISQKVKEQELKNAWNSAF